jgi:spore germination protein
MQTLLILDIFGAGIITLPRKASEYAGQDAWILIIIITALAVGSAFLMASAGRILPKDSFVALTSKLLSKPVGKIIGILFACKLLFNCALELRLFGEIVRQKLLSETPFFIVCAIMLAISAYAAAKGYETRARLAQILFPIIFIPIVFIFLLAIHDIDFTNLLPVFSVLQSHPLDPVGAANIGAAFTGLELILLVTPYAVRPRAVRGGLTRAVIFIGVFMVFITVITLSKFGAKDVTRQLWPVLEMMDMTDLPGSFIERQDALIMSFWIISNFAIVNGCLFFSCVLLKDTVGKGKHSTYIFICAAIILVIACALMKIENVDRIMELIFKTLGLGLMVALPIILLIAARIRKVGEK